MDVKAISIVGVGAGAGVAPAAKAASGAFQKIFQDVSKADPAKIVNAAKQFEALMIGQVLKAAHGDGSGGWLGAGDDDESSSTAIQMAEEYLGQAISNGGGLGIAKMVVKGLEKGASTPSSSAPAAAVPAPPRTD